MNIHVSGLEEQNLRVVVGNNTPTTHPILGNIPVKGTFPQAITLTGTITTDNSGGVPAMAGKLVQGVGTLFIDGEAGASKGIKPELGDFLAHPTTREIRRIAYIRNNLQLVLDVAFSASVSAVAVLLVKKNRYRWILMTSSGTAAPSLQEQTFPVGEKTFTDGAPVSYDVSTANSQISFTLSL